MKQSKLFSGVIYIITLIAFLSFATQAQQGKKIRASLKAGVSQTIGIDTDISIVYSRPGVKGREIWGKLVPYGLAPGDKESGNKAFPWRGGANEATTFEVSKDVMINGQKLPAGIYSMHFIPSEKDWTVIFNKDAKQWGSFNYDKTKDALRITVTPVKAPMTEWLTYGFDDLAGTSCTAYLQWEKLRVPFKVAVVE